jgi:hypothetical protein
VDTMLLVNTPDGNWHFNDDIPSAPNSSITFENPMQGQYDIWTGSYSPRPTTPRSFSSPKLSY